MELHEQSSIIGESPLLTHSVESTSFASPVAAKGKLYQRDKMQAFETNLHDEGQLKACPAPVVGMGGHSHIQPAPLSGQ